MAKLGKTFSRLVSTSQSFEKRAEYIEVNLQFLIEESHVWCEESHVWYEEMVWNNVSSEQPQHP